MTSQTAPAPSHVVSETPVDLLVPRAATRGAYWRLALFVLFLAALFLPGFYMDPGFRLPKFNRFMALALYALSVDLIWGYTGLLSLGQGLYFGIGGYLVGYSLILQKAALEEGNPRYAFGPDMALPPFMFQNRLTEVPTWIAPLIDIWTAVGPRGAAPHDDCRRLWLGRIPAAHQGGLFLLDHPGRGARGVPPRYQSNALYGW